VGHSGLSLVVLLLSALFYMCTNEEGGVLVPSPQEDEEDREMALSLRLQGSLPSTRLGEADENMVSEVDVLVFECTTGKYLYASAAYYIDEPEITQSLVYKYPFAVRLRMTESEADRVDLWVVANAHALLNKMTLGGTSADSTKAAVAAKLLANEDDKVTQIPVTDPVTPIPIPMWGKIDNVSIPISGATPVEVPLTRMVAKIDVAVDKTKVDENKFRLKSTNVTTGHKIPAEGVNPSTDVTVTFDGTYTGQFTVTAYSGSTAVGSNTNSTKTSRGVTVGENQSWTERGVTYKWKAPGYNNNNEINVSSLQTTQLGYTINLTGCNYYIEEKAYQFKLTGNYPERIRSNGRNYEKSRLTLTVISLIRIASDGEGRHNCLPARDPDACPSHPTRKRRL
jgi:hypothetical protein